MRGEDFEYDKQGPRNDNYHCLLEVMVIRGGKSRSCLRNMLRCIHLARQLQEAPRQTAGYKQDKVKGCLSVAGQGNQVYCMISFDQVGIHLSVYFIVYQAIRGGNNGARHQEYTVTVEAGTNTC